MEIQTVVFENQDAHRELSELIARIDGRSFKYQIGSSWTVASTLCHLAFWDRRVLSLLREWGTSGKVEALKLDSRSIDSINQAVNAISLEVPGPAAAKLALENASVVDAHVSAIGDELAEKIVAAGFERFLRRSLHRREHLQKILEVLGPARTP